MTSGTGRISLAAAGSLALALTLAACGHDSSPRQIQASNPTVTYKYSNDRDLVEANQRATSFCSQYQSTPRTLSLTTDRDGDRIAVFECVNGATTGALTPAPTSSLTYTYRTDQELLEASRTAQTYCANRGAAQVLSNVTTNANGTRTVTFQCAG